MWYVKLFCQTITKGIKVQCDHIQFYNIHKIRRLGSSTSMWFYHSNIIMFLYIFGIDTLLESMKNCHLGWYFVQVTTLSLKIFKKKCLKYIWWLKNVKISITKYKMFCHLPRWEDFIICKCSLVLVVLPCLFLSWK